MRAFGIAVEMPKPGRPVVHCVVLDDPHGAAHVAALTDVTQFEAFDLRTTETEWSKIVAQFSQDVSGRVSTLAPDVVVIRRADVYVKGRLGDGPRLRLAVEGAITAAAMAHVANTHLRTGSDCAGRYGKSKEQMDTDALALTGHSNQQEAAAAALSGLFGHRA